MTEPRPLGTADVPALETRQPDRDQYSHGGQPEEDASRVEPVLDDLARG